MENLNILVVGGLRRLNGLGAVGPGPESKKLKRGMEEAQWTGHSGQKHTMDWL